MTLSSSSHFWSFGAFTRVLGRDYRQWLLGKLSNSSAKFRTRYQAVSILLSSMPLDINSPALSKAFSSATMYRQRRDTDTTMLPFL